MFTEFGMPNSLGLINFNGNTPIIEMLQKSGEEMKQVWICFIKCKFFNGKRNFVW
jgi:hypothetical protein